MHQLFDDAKRCLSSADYFDFNKVDWIRLDVTGYPFDRRRTSWFVERLDCDERTKVLYHAAFGTARAATDLFMRMVLMHETGGVGVCRALAELVRGQAECVPGAAADLLRAAVPSLAPLCAPVLEAHADDGGWRWHPLRRDPMFVGDDAFLKGVCGDGSGGGAAALMAAYALSGDAPACRRAALAAARGGAAPPPALLACVPLLAGEAARSYGLLLGARDDDASWPLDRSWTALRELRPTLVLDGEPLPEAPDGCEGAIRVAVTVAAGRLVLHCSARTDCMFPKLDWLTHAFLARRLQERPNQPHGDVAVTLDLLEGCPATAALPAAAGAARPGLPTAAALQALLIAAHPGMRTGGCVDGRVVAAALSPRLATALQPEGVEWLVDSSLDRFSVPCHRGGDALALASSMAALSDRLSAFPEELLGNNWRSDRDNEGVAQYVRGLGRLLTPVETLIVRRISPTVRRWASIIDYAAAAPEGDAPERHSIRAVLMDAALAEQQVAAPSRQPKVGAALRGNKRRKVEADARTASAGRGECIAAMERVLAAAEDLRAAAAEPGRPPGWPGGAACGRLLLIAAWQDAVNSHSGQDA